MSYAQPGGWAFVLSLYCFNYSEAGGTNTPKLGVKEKLYFVWVAGFSTVLGA
jgi:hypothetical protein